MTATDENSRMTKTTYSFLVVSMLLLVSGCMSSGSLTHVQESRTMDDIYEAHFINLAYEKSEYVFLHEQEDSSRISEAVVKNTKQTFPTLKNPFLVMYVYPHLDPKEGTPILGYWTAFPMYEQIEFALPGEEIDSGVSD